MKKTIIILLLLITATCLFAESTLQISASNSVASFIMEPVDWYWFPNYIWPYNLDVGSLTYLHDISAGSPLQIGCDIGGGTWGTFISADVAYSMPAFTAGRYDVTFRAIEKLGVYIPYISLINITDLELTANRPDKRFFFGAGISTSVSALWGNFVNMEDGSTESSYKIVVRPSVKFTCGWKLR